MVATTFAEALNPDSVADGDFNEDGVVDVADFVNAGGKTVDPWKITRFGKKRSLNRSAAVLALLQVCPSRGRAAAHSWCLVLNARRFALPNAISASVRVTMINKR